MLKYSKLLLLLTILFTNLLLESCGPDQIEKSNIESILAQSDSIYFSETKQQSPKIINLYIDLSASITYYLYKDVKQSKDNKLFEDFLREIFNSKQNAQINVYGFGDSLFYIGNNNEIIGNLLNKEIYTHKTSNINLAFDKIKNDTTGSLNFIITDAMYENTSGNSNDELFLIGEDILKLANNNKLIGLFANHFSYYHKSSKKYYNVPLYLFVFGERSYYNYLVNNFLQSSDDIYINSPIDKINSSLVLSDNLELVIPERKFSLINVGDYSKPGEIDINFERELKDKNFLKLTDEDNLRISLMEKTISEMGESVNDWKISSISDPKIVLTSKLNNDSTKQIINVKFNKNITENNSYTLYKLVIWNDIPGWIEDNYSSTNSYETEKTYRFKDLFNSLQNKLKDSPVPLFTYYLIIK